MDQTLKEYQARMASMVQTRDTQGRLHSFDDKPAEVMDGGYQKWYKHGVMHREGGPAIISCEGTQYWMQDDRFHREDGPAVIGRDRQIWYREGKIHREDGPAYIDGAKKRVIWYSRGVRHREDGPAVTYDNGREEWWENGKNVKSPANREHKTTRIRT